MFGNQTITCTVDGQVDHVIPYVVARGDVLVIDFSSMIPHFNRYTESYKIMRRGDNLWLYDRRTRFPHGFWMALKLTSVPPFG